jgi:phosphotransferase system IIA component
VPVTLTISGVTATNKIYDGTTTDTLSDRGDSPVGAFAGDVGNVSLVNAGASGTFASANVGTGIVVTASGFTITGSAAGNYTLIQPTGLTANITAATLTILGVSANNKIYDGTTTATLSDSGDSLLGVFPSDVGNVTLNNSGASASFASANVGTGIALTASGFTITGPAAGNYTLTQPTGLTANITPVALTISGSSLAMSRPSGGVAAPAVVVCS